MAAARRGRATRLPRHPPRGDSAAARTRWWRPARAAAGRPRNLWALAPRRASSGRGRGALLAPAAGGGRARRSDERCQGDPGGARVGRGGAAQLGVRQMGSGGGRRQGPPGAGEAGPADLGGWDLLKIYTPRPQQAELHRTLKRFNVLVAHRRFGKTVFCINQLVRRAAENKRGDPRYAYVAPLLGQAKDVAWEYLKRYTAEIP